MRIGSGLLVVVSLLAACAGGGGGAGPNVPPPSGSGSASASASASSAGSAAASASASASASAPPPVGHMKPPTATAMSRDLTEIGLDAKNLPAMAKLEPDKLRKVMKLFSKSLGLQCNGCHLDDLAAATPRKRVAEKMWDDYARGFAMADGSALFCDSCHQASVTILDRTDKRALSKWMDASFIAKLKPKPAKGVSGELECSSCHGEDHEMHFIDLWKAGKPFSPHK